MRSSGIRTSHVDGGGYGNHWFTYQANSRNGVRPALHINLSTYKVKDAGKVDSEGNVLMSDGRINNPTVKDGVTTWNCVYFGDYRQNCIFEKQAIEWRVLSVDGDNAVLLADKILDCKPYNEKWEDVTWETCTLRKWLNEDFYNEAFDDNEKKAVRETTVVSEDYPYYDITEGGSDTKDKVYLLSIAEVCSGSALSFDTQFLQKSKTREAKNTEYAKFNGAHTFTVDGVDNGDWWLRSSGSASECASNVACDGHGEISTGYDVDYVPYISLGVRPALRINLSSSLWSKAGQVTAARNSDYKPTATKEPTTEPTRKPALTDKPVTPFEPIQNPTVTSQPTPPIVTTQNPILTAQPTPPTVTTQTPTPTSQPVLKQLKLSAVKYTMNTRKITGKVSVSKATVKIKVGKRAYKKAIVKGKKFTLKLNYKLKKRTKVIIKVEKKGYKSLVKVYT